MSDSYRIPLWSQSWNTYTNHRDNKKGVSIKTSDLEDTVPPLSVNKKHREIQDLVEKDTLPKKERKVGWIETDGEEVLDWYIDEEYTD